MVIKMKKKAYRAFKNAQAELIYGLLLFGCVCFCFLPAFDGISYASPKIIYENEEDSIEIRNAQEKLKELGYLKENTTYVVDMNMRYALKLFCVNNCLDYANNGISQEVWDKLMSGQDLVGNLSQEEDAFIPFGEESDEVTQIQIQLKNLGYFRDSSITASVFDAPTLHAIESFCIVNNLNFEGSSISKSVKDILFSDAAIAYRAPIIGGIAKIRNFLNSYILVKNIRVPNLLWIILLCIFVYACIIGLVFMIFKHRKRHTMGVAPKVIYKSGSPESILSAVEPNRCVDFQISYNGKMRKERCTIKEEFNIGRKSNLLHLDKSDKAISRKHCSLFFYSNVLQLENLSQYGTFVNGELVLGKGVELHSGDQIQIGNHLVIIRY